MYRTLLALMFMVFLVNELRAQPQIAKEVRFRIDVVSITV